MLMGYQSYIIAYQSMTSFLLAVDNHQVRKKNPTTLTQP